MNDFIICYNCKAKMPAEAKFCPKCGTAVEDSIDKDKNTTAETCAGSSSNASPAASEKNRRGTKKKLFIGIGIAAAAAVVVIALALGLSKGNKPSENGGGTAVANSNTMSAQTSGSSEVKIEAIKSYDSKTRLTSTSEPQKPRQQQTDSSSGDYILPTSSSQYLDRAVIAALSVEDLRLARNEIYARHGRKFNAEDLQAYFNSKTWYKPTIEAGDFDTNGGNLLNDYEKVNLETILQEEQKR